MMDRRTLIAIALSALVLILVPLLLERLGLVPSRRPPGTEQPPDTAARAVPGAPDTGTTMGAPRGTVTSGPGAGGAEPAQPSGTPETAFASALVATDRVVSAPTDVLEAHLSSRGARLLGLDLFRFRSAGDGNVSLAGNPTLRIELGGAGAPDVLAGAPFEVAESTGADGAVRKVRFIAADTLGLRVIQSYSFQPGTYLADLEVEIEGAAARGINEYSIRLTSWPLVTERNVSEDVRSLQAVSRVGQEIRRDSYKDLEKKGARTHEGSVGWVAVRSKYFTVAAIPVQANAIRSSAQARRLAIEARSTSAEWTGQQVAGTLVLPVPPPGTRHHFKIYAGPNDYWILEKAGYGLQEVVDLGWRWLLPFSRAILVVMVFLKQYIPNFGLVIIALSALVRLVFHPLNNASLKSMRAMQKLQPELERLRKRYEKEPQKMNQAVMDLYREHKVNPLGGCLPLLVQMPVLIALYQVFMHAIDLRQAHFFLWINDLSSPDEVFSIFGFPIRILPLIMFLSTWLQQGLTPTDPRQKVTMILMNVFMLVLFYNLPSGLVLYWTVTNLLTAAQMYLIHRGDLRQQSKAAA